MNIIKDLTTENYTPNRNWQRIKRVIIHWIGAGTAESAVQWFKNPNAEASAHYIVSNSKIYQCVEEKNTAWHAGNWDINLESIGIEHEALPDHPATEETYRTSAALIADICKRYNIEINRSNIIGHNEVELP